MRAGDFTGRGLRLILGDTMLVQLSTSTWEIDDNRIAKRVKGRAPGNDKRFAMVRELTDAADDVDFPTCGHARVVVFETMSGGGRSWDCHDCGAKGRLGERVTLAS